MTREEQALKRILKAVAEKDKYWVMMWYGNHKDYCELRDPVEEGESKDGEYFCRRIAFVSDFDGEINYGYSVYKWDGTYTEKQLVPGSDKVFKFKNWCEIFHSHGPKKVEPVEMIDAALAAMNAVKGFDS